MKLFDWASLVDPFSNPETRVVLSSTNPMQKTPTRTFLRGCVSQTGMGKTKDVLGAKSSFLQACQELEPFSEFKLYAIEGTASSLDYTKNNLRLLKGYTLMMLLYGEDVIGAREKMELAIEANGEIGCSNTLADDKELGTVLSKLFLVLMSEINLQIQFDKLVAELGQKIAHEGSQKHYEILLHLALNPVPKIRKSHRVVEILSNHLPLLHPIIQTLALDLNIMRSASVDNILFKKYRIMVIETHELLWTMFDSKDPAFTRSIQSIYQILQVLVKLFDKIEEKQHKQAVLDCLFQIEFGWKNNYKVAEEILTKAENQFKVPNSTHQALKRKYWKYKIWRFDKRRQDIDVSDLRINWMKLLTFNQTDAEDNLAFLYYIGRTYQLDLNNPNNQTAEKYFAKAFEQLPKTSALPQTFSLYRIIRKLARKLKANGLYRFEIRVPQGKQQPIKIRIPEYNNMMMVEQENISQGRMLERQQGTVLYDGQQINCLVRKWWILKLEDYRTIIKHLANVLKYQGGGAKKISIYSAKEIRTQTEDQQRTPSDLSIVNSLGKPQSNSTPSYMQLSIVTTPYAYSLATMPKTLWFNDLLYISVKIFEILSGLAAQQIHLFHINCKSFNVELMQFVDCIFLNEGEEVFENEFEGSESKTVYMFGMLLKKIFSPNVKKGKEKMTSYQPLVQLIEKMITKNIKERPTLIEVGKVIKDIYTTY